MPASTTSTSSRVYGAHRERQRHRILRAAEKLFDELGIDRVSIAEIVAETGIRQSTLYEYFANKDEIVWAILEELMVTASKDVQAIMEQLSGNALAKITALFRWMEEELVHHPERVRFMAQFDALYARDWPAERLITLEENINPRWLRSLGDLIREGIADGSLRSDLDPDLTMHSILNTVVGSQRRLALLGSRVEEEYRQPVDRLFRESIRIVLLGLRAAKAGKLR